MRLVVDMTKNGERTPPPPVRVLHVLGSSKSEGAGVAHVVASLARHLQPRHFHSEALFVGEDGPLVAEFRQQDIPVGIVPWHHPSRDIAGLVRLWLKLSNGHHDIIHLHWGGRAVRAAARHATNAKIILHLHSQVDESSGRSISPVSANNLDAVVAVSKSVSIFSRHPCTYVFHTGVDSQPQRADHDRTPVVIIGAAGRLVRWKGINTLLRAFQILHQQFPQVRLEIAGDGAERNALEQQASDLDISSHVRFLGWVANPNLLEKFSQWKIFAQPSLSEGLGISVLQAMAAGLPVIASNVGGLVEVVVPGVTGRLVSVQDPNMLAEALRELLLHPEEAEHMGEAGRQRVESVFSAQAMARNIANIYNELLEKETSFSNRRERK